MGVTGSGKTTIGKAVASMLGVAFVDADDFHSAAARQRMAAGQALTDKDRQPWLRDLNAVLRRHAAAGCVLACSALRRRYRRSLAKGLHDVVFVALVVPADVLEARLLNRRAHFAHADLLSSQLATLELGDDVIPIDGNRPTEIVVQSVVAAVDRGG